MRSRWVAIGIVVLVVGVLAVALVRLTVESPSSSNVFRSVFLPNLFLFVIIGGIMWYWLRASRGLTQPLLLMASHYLRLGGSVEEAARLYRRAAETDPELMRTMTVGGRDLDASIRHLVEVAAHLRDLPSGALPGWIFPWPRRGPR